MPPRRPGATDATQLAVSIMAEWLGDPDGVTDRVATLVRTTVAERHPDDVVRGLVEVINGLVNLSGTLLLERADRPGVNAETQLQRIAERLARASQ